MFSKLKNNTLVEVIKANALVVSFRVVASLATQKVLAVYVGAEGIALVGYLKNAIRFFEQWSVFGAGNGVIKFVAQLRDKGNERQLLYRSVNVLVLVVSIVSVAVLNVFAQEISVWLFPGKNNLDFLVRILSFIVPFMGVRMLWDAIVKGHVDHQKYVRVTLFGLSLSAVLIIGLLLAQLIQLFGYVIFDYGRVRSILQFPTRLRGLPYLKPLLGFSALMLSSSLATNGVEVLIRRTVEMAFSQAEAGYWTAVDALSKQYMQFTAVVFPLYVLPRYSRIQELTAWRRELFHIAKWLLPPFVLGLAAVYFLRSPITLLLFSDEFTPMLPYVKWQVIGDFFMLSATLLTYKLLADKKLLRLLFLELFSVSLFYGLARLLILKYGVEGVVMAHSVRAMLYLIIVILVMRVALFHRRNPKP